MKHAKLLIVLSSLVAMFFVALVLTALFSVKDLPVTYSVYGKAEFSEVEEVLSKYKGKNLFFVKTDEIKKDINENTSFTVEKVEKKYPSTIEVVLSSRQERYAVVSEDGFYILDDVFTVCDKRSSSLNSADGLDNVIVEFSPSIAPTLTVKKRADVENDEALKIMKEVFDEIPSPRDCVRSVFFEDKGYGDIYITIVFTEGVSAEIRKADEKTSDKVKKTYEKYVASDDGDKLSGKIICFEMQGGVIVADYERP